LGRWRSLAQQFTQGSSALRGGDSRLLGGDGARNARWKQESHPRVELIMRWHRRIRMLLPSGVLACASTQPHTLYSWLPLSQFHRPGNQHLLALATFNLCPMLDWQHYAQSSYTCPGKTLSSSIRDSALIIAGTTTDCTIWTRVSSQLHSVCRATRTRQSTTSKRLVYSQRPISQRPKTRVRQLGANDIKSALLLAVPTEHLPRPAAPVS
jgi:hypothetical protein